MDKSLHSGEWFLPGSNLKFPGRLLFEEESKEIILELIGDKYLSADPVINNSENRDNRYNSKNYNNDFTASYLLILGNARGLITLYNSRWAGTEDLGKDLYIIKYSSQFVFWSVHIDSIEHFSIKSATLIYPYLASWFDGSESSNKMEVFENKEFSISDSINNQHRVPPIRVKDGLEFILYDEYTRRMEEIGVYHTVKYQKLIKFRYVKPVPFADMISDISVFNKLLEFCLCKPLKQKLLGIEINKHDGLIYRDHCQPTDYIDSPVGNYSLHDGENIKKHFQHQSHMLLSKWIMETDELNRIIQKWYANTAYFAIYDFFIDSNNWFQNSDALLSNVMFNNRFLNIVQGLEAYYKKWNDLEENNPAAEDPAKIEFEKNKKIVLSKIEDKQLRQWGNNNLNYKAKHKREDTLEEKFKILLESLNEILEPIFGQNEVLLFFPRFASRIRNNLSHGLNEKTNQGGILHLYFNLGQILLAICILKSLDVKDIKYKIEHYNAFNKYIYEIERTKLVFV
jgi:hypothetical protein